MVLLAYLGTALAAYLLGSIPTGYLLARARGIDIRTVGSGNIGATNAFRALGVPSGILVLVIDGLKGWVAAAPLPGLVMQVVMGAYSGVALDREYLMITAAICVILGHNFTCWLRFRGGKGIATSAGALAALVPASFVMIFVVWLVVFAASRYVSLASIAAAIALPLATWLLRYSQLLIFVTTLMAALALYKHRPNIRRLIAGTENRVGRPKTPTIL